MNSFKPYYAVIFSSYLSDDIEGYEAMSEKMLELVKKQEGYLGHESARDGIGITVSCLLYTSKANGINISFAWRYHVK